MARILSAVYTRADGEGFSEWEVERLGWAGTRARSASPSARAGARSDGAADRANARATHGAFAAVAGARTLPQGGSVSRESRLRQRHSVLHRRARHPLRDGSP